MTTLMTDFVYYSLVLCAIVTQPRTKTPNNCYVRVGPVQTVSCFVLQVEEITPDVPLPGLKQKGKEAEAIGKLKGPQSGPGAADQVTFCSYQPSVVYEH